MTNRLENETSPYLRQHRDNPVDWFAWGEEAFDLAKSRNVPILLSVGYSACHWCHVMAHECFEDVETATLMNKLFVNVKVDREERPDVDAIYMDAVQAMTGRGGWPMTVFLTPEGKPFYGGTYFPKPSFLQLMNAINDAWRDRRDDIESNVLALMESLERTTKIEQDTNIPGIDVFHGAVAQLRKSFDPHWGGFGSAPKFPSTMSLELLLREVLNSESDEIQTIIATTLDAMASGGMYDHIGGGFSRYSVDEKWLVPHFEKMLYDQALLARIYLHAGIVFGRKNWLDVATEIIDYVLRDLRHPQGGFFSAEDADSLDDHGHSHEGHFYVWSKQQFTDVLPPELAKQAIEWYEITEEGNFEGTNIPARLHHRGDITRPADIEKARRILFDSRKTRVRPGLDDKVITEWNAMMLSTIAEAASLMGRADWLEAALLNGEFLVNNLRDENGEWKRSWHDSGSPKARHHALAADISHLVDAFTRLGEASGQAKWMLFAREAADNLLDNYWDNERGGVFTTPKTGETLIVRQKDVMDNATPSANSTAANALYRLGALSGEEKYAHHADSILRLLSRISTSAPTAFSNLLNAVHLRHVGVTEVVITGYRSDLLREFNKRWIPTAVIAWGETYESPLFANRKPDLAYVCKKYACMSPSGDPAQFVEALREALK
jgi:uncharacterized protein YyaL (SSP411 family)